MDKKPTKEAPKRQISKARDRLSSLAVKRISEPGVYHDGGGLYLQVSRTDNRTKSWFLRYTIEGKVRDMGLGSLTEWSLAEARERAKQMRRTLDDKLDPIEVRLVEREAQKAAAIARSQELAKQKSFADCAIACHASLKSGWKNPKHAAQWISTLKAYAFPTLGKRNIAEVEKHAIGQALKPIWLEKAETADRTLQRIRTVLDWAVANEFHPGYKPSLWKDLQIILPQRLSTARKHFASCPYEKVGGLLQQLKALQISDMLKLCFEFMVLTAARSVEARGALKSEFDLKNKIWRIDGERMKMGVTHTVPLSERAVQIVRQAIALSGPGCKYLFPSSRNHKPFSDQAYTKVVLKDNLKVAFTAHGFRSSFRTWAGKETNYDRVVCELCLAHDVKEESEAPYDRNDYEEKRRLIMQDWANYIVVTAQLPSDSAPV